MQPCNLFIKIFQIYGEKFGPEINTASSEEGSGSARRGRRTRKPSEHSADRYTQYGTILLLYLFHNNLLYSCN